MDSQNRALFNEMVDGMTVRGALIDFALSEGVNTDL
jgi:hypothetical protein